MGAIPKTTVPLAKFIRTGEGILVFAFNLTMLIVPIVSNALTPEDAVKWAGIVNGTAVICRTGLKVVSVMQGVTGIPPAQIGPVLTPAQVPVPVSAPVPVPVSVPVPVLDPVLDPGPAPEPPHVVTVVTPTPAPVPAPPSAPSPPAPAPVAEDVSDDEEFASTPPPADVDAAFDQVVLVNPGTTNGGGQQS